MADPARFVGYSESKIREIVNAIQTIKANAADLTYRNARLGSSTYTNQHFFEDEAMTIPRTDLAYSAADFSTALYNITILGDIIGNDNMAALMKITG